MCRKTNFYLLCRPHDVLASEAGAWSALSSLHHSRPNFTFRNIELFLVFRPHDVLTFEVGAWSTLHHFIIIEKDMSKSYRSQLNIFYI